MYKFECTIVDDDGVVVEEFQHKQQSIDAAERFELMLLEAIRLRDGKPRFFYSKSNQDT